MKEVGIGQKRIGVIGLDPYPPFYFDGPMPYHTWKTVLDAFPDATFVQVGRPVLRADRRDAATKSWRY